MIPRHPFNSVSYHLDHAQGSVQTCLFKLGVNYIFEQIDETAPNSPSPCEVRHGFIVQLGEEGNGVDQRHPIFFSLSLLRGSSKQVCQLVVDYFINYHAQLTRKPQTELGCFHCHLRPHVPEIRIVGSFFILPEFAASSSDSPLSSSYFFISSRICPLVILLRICICMVYLEGLHIWLQNSRQIFCGWLDDISPPPLR